MTSHSEFTLLRAFYPGKNWGPGQFKSLSFYLKRQKLLSTFKIALSPLSPCRVQSESLSLGTSYINVFKTNALGKGEGKRMRGMLKRLKNRTKQKKACGILNQSRFPSFYPVHTHRFVPFRKRYWKVLAHKLTHPPSSTVLGKE